MITHGDEAQVIHLFESFGGHVESRAADPSVLKLAEAIGRRAAEKLFAKLYGDEP
jgi:hypothetical protein